MAKRGLDRDKNIKDKAKKKKKKSILSRFKIKKDRKPAKLQTPVSAPRKEYKKEDKLQPATTIKQSPIESGPRIQEYAPITKPKTKAKAFVDSNDLPASYNITTINLIARDPYWIHADWEIAPSSIEEIRKKIGSELDRSSYTLRMYDVTYIDFNGSNANHWFDIDVGLHTNNWYISLWQDNVTYCADIGIRTPDGRFFTLARSNFVTTPRVGSSGRSEMIWMEVKEDRSQQPFVIIETRKREDKRLLPSTKISPSEVGRLRRKIFLTEDDIRSYYSKLFPFLRQVISARLARESGVKKRGPERYKIYLKDGDILLEDFLIRDMTKEQFIKKILLGSSEELVLLGGASEFAKGASEREQKRRKFFFEIGTELIVYGRTEPNAEVWFGDKQIKLRKDGTFSLRFALPEGKIPLDFVTQSHDKIDKRNITTAVERTKTKYKP